MPARDSCCAARDYYAKALVDSALSVVVERRQFSGRFGRRRVEVTGASPLLWDVMHQCAVLPCCNAGLLALREAALAALLYWSQTLRSDGVMALRCL